MTTTPDTIETSPARDTTPPDTTTARHGPSVPTGACTDCLRRSRLLAWLSSRLEYRAKDHERLVELLALGDEDLLRAVGGRRWEELKARYAQFDPSEEVESVEGVEGVCRHDRAYPRALRNEGAPQMLRALGGVERLGELASAPVVAIVGSRRATDYGMEMAKSLARGLVASGVTVASGLDDGIAVAAHAGALEVDRGSVAVMPGGLDVACPARRRTLYARLTAVGCAVAELPCGSPVRRWCHPACARIIAQLARLTIVVEADEDPVDLRNAQMAQALGKTVAAMPGRVTSPMSRGTHALLMAGARLVRGPQDALDLLYGLEASVPIREAAQPKISLRREDSTQQESAAPRKASTAVGKESTARRKGSAVRQKVSSRPNAPARSRSTPQRAQTELEPRLRIVLERVGAGLDTPDKLTEKDDTGEVLTALSELELLGLLARGDGGRYVPRRSLPA
jgi:DNA processing protein